MSRIDARIVKHLPAVKETPAFELNVHLRIDAGITVMVGPSGAGKTLILDSIGGFVRPDEGRILVDDQIYFDAPSKLHLPPERRRCGYIFQDHALFPHMTVRQNLRFAAETPHSRAGRLNLHRRINELLESFDLGNLGDRKPAQLSGGQQQRAALARILITQPAVLLLDEPSRGLDASLRQSFHELLRSLRERLEAPVLLVSHDIGECFELADSVVVIEKGRVLQEGASEMVFARPVSVGVASLLGIYNIVPAEIQALDPVANSSRLRVLNQEIDGPYLPGHLIGDTGHLCIRRSELKLVPPSQSNGNRRLSLRLEAVQPSPYGLRLDLEHKFRLLVRESEFEIFRDAERLTLEVPPSALSFTA